MPLKVKVVVGTSGTTNGEVQRTSESTAFSPYGGLGRKSASIVKTTSAS